MPETKRRPIRGLHSLSVVAIGLLIDLRGPESDIRRLLPRTVVRNSERLGHSVGIEIDVAELGHCGFREHQGQGFRADHLPGPGLLPATGFR
jgi:hypothetical protein